MNDSAKPLRASFRLSVVQWYIPSERFSLSLGTKYYSTSDMHMRLLIDIDGERMERSQESTSCEDLHEKPRSHLAGEIGQKLGFHGGMFFISGCWKIIHHS